MKEGEVTLLLQAAGEGDRAAYARLYEAVYAELRRIAGANLRREKPGHTLQPTALVNEAYLRLAPGAAWENRRHFFALADYALIVAGYEASRLRCAPNIGAMIRRVIEAGLPFVAPALCYLLAFDDSIHGQTAYGSVLSKAIALPAAI